MLRVAIEGASGYSGMELTRLLTRHPELELAGVSSSRWAGQSVEERLGPLSRAGGLRYQARLDESFDAVVLATPADASRELAPRWRQDGARVVDLSNAFRADSTAVYGLTEHHREAVRSAELVANPGCYPTAVGLSVLPLLKAGLIADGALLIDAKSGATGAGRASQDHLLFNQLADNHFPYRVGSHQHVPEIERSLGREVLFTPHLLPTRRGLLSETFVPVHSAVTADQIIDCLQAAYIDEPLVQVVEAGLEMGLATVIHTPMCRVAAAPIIKAGWARVFGVLDNLLKGAASQAVQNLNVMLGLDELGGVIA